MDQQRQQTLAAQLSRGQIGFFDRSGRVVAVHPVIELKLAEVREQLGQLYLAGQIRTVICACKPGGVRMYTRLRSSRVEICERARGCEQHAPDCPRHGRFLQHPRDLDRERHRGVGLDRLLAPRPIKRHTPRDGLAPPPEEARDTRPQITGVHRTLGAGLLALWDAAALNQYDSASPAGTWPSVANRLGVELDQHASRRRKQTAMVVGYDAGELSLAEAIGVDESRVVIGCIRRVRHRATCAEVFLVGLAAPVIVAIKQWNHAVQTATSRCVRQMLSARGGASGHVVIAMDVRISAAGTVEVGSIGLMPVSRAWIQVESTHERDAADRLVAAGYRFTKDIYLPDGWEYRPDFRLHLSDGGDFVLEVNGLETPEYQQRKGAVAAWLERTLPRRYAIWQVKRGEPFPTLPPP